MKSEKSKFFNNLDIIKSNYSLYFKTNWVSNLNIFLAIIVASSIFLIGLIQLEFSIYNIFFGIGKIGSIVYLMMPPNPESWSRVLIYSYSIGETLAIAILGTILAMIFAFPLSFFASRNVMSNRLLQLFSRRIFDTIRGVDTLVWALIWINVVGLGPFAGVLAIMTSDIGAFGKLFSETIESVDRKPIEAIKASGGTKFHTIVYGIVPEILPIITSQVLYYIESNTRSATIIGIVGAGGIGMHLSEQIRTLEWQQTSTIIFMILVTVAIIDYISSRIRFSIIGPLTR